TLTMTVSSNVDAELTGPGIGTIDSDNITRHLDPGSYQVDITISPGFIGPIPLFRNEDYDIQLGFQYDDGHDNTLATTRNLGTLSGTRSVSDSLASQASDDFSKFTAPAGAFTLAATVAGLTGNATLDLIRDFGADGHIDSGDVLKSVRVGQGDPDG